MVTSITGVPVRDRIPDEIFDRADQVELVDIEPSDLIERMSTGAAGRAQQSQRAAWNSFSVQILTALREIALRRCADRVNLLTEDARHRRHSRRHVDEHILVCLSSSPSNAKIIRTAARMAAAFHGVDLGHPGEVNHVHLRYWATRPATSAYEGRARERSECCYKTPYRG